MRRAGAGIEADQNKARYDEAGAVVSIFDSSTVRDVWTSRYRQHAHNNVSFRCGLAIDHDLSFCRSATRTNPWCRPSGMVIDCCTQIFQIATCPLRADRGLSAYCPQVCVSISARRLSKNVQAADPVGEPIISRLRGPSFEVVVSR
jgi:hypothetical protein